MQEPYNISLYPGTGSVDGRRGDHIIIAPAYNITAVEIEQIVETTAAVIQQYFLRQHAYDWFVAKLASANTDDDLTVPKLTSSRR